MKTSDCRVYIYGDIRVWMSCSSAVETKITITRHVKTVWLHLMHSMWQQEHNSKEDPSDEILHFNEVSGFKFFFQMSCQGRVRISRNTRFPQCNSNPVEISWKLWKMFSNDIKYSVQKWRASRCTYCRENSICGNSCRHTALPLRGKPSRGMLHTCCLLPSLALLWF